MKTEQIRGEVTIELSKMMVEHNAIVVMEDLNFGFKRGRFAVERQIYQKFENMLIEKLNYLVFKDKKVTEHGGVLNAYQLTNKSSPKKSIRIEHIETVIGNFASADIRKIKTYNFQKIKTYRFRKIRVVRNTSEFCSGIGKRQMVVYL